MSLSGLLFPPACPFCRRWMKTPGVICPDCQESLPWRTGAKARRQVDLLEGCASALGYEGLVRGCIRRYKFSRRRGYAPVLGQLTAQCAHDHFPQRFDLISWPPVSPRTLHRRGFDQARLLAQAVAQDRGMVETPLFSKKSSVPQQSTISFAAGRRANILGAFTLTADPEDIRGKRVLLVDDVVTTGATLCECARLLLMAGAEGVWAVTLATAVLKPPPGA